MLIPEIALTTQAVDRYRRRLGLSSVAVIHSGLNDSQRYLAWSRIARGDYQVLAVDREQRRRQRRRAVAAECRRRGSRARTARRASASR